MPEKLGETYQIVVIVLQVAMGEGVAQGMRMNFRACQRRILGAQGANALVGHRPALPDEETFRCDGRSALHVRREDATNGHGQGAGSLLPTLAVSEDDSAPAFAHQQIIEFELNEVAHATSREQQDVKDR
jgi:hypothetical protein